MFSTKRLKKKSQSVDMTAAGYGSPIAANDPLSQSDVIPAVLKTTRSEEVQNNGANTQKRNAKRSELQRYYTLDTGQKKLQEKKDTRWMSSQKPKGTIEYTVESRDSLNSIALKFDTTPNELVQLNKLFSRAVVPGQNLYVPDPDYISSVESSPSLSPVSPLSATSSEIEFEKPSDVENVQHKDSTVSPTHSCIRPARVVSSTSEEEEAFTEKFLKITCRYITHDKGAVTGVLLVTPNNIMFDPHKHDPLIKEHGCEEYGIMCPMEEILSAAMYKDVLDSKIKESLPPELKYSASIKDVHQLNRSTRSNTEEVDSKLRDTGNDSTSTAPRSTEESLSEDVFTESELSPIREELISSDEPRQNKSSGASLESVQTINQAAVEGRLLPSSTEMLEPNDEKLLAHTDDIPASKPVEVKGNGNQTVEKSLNDDSPDGSGAHHSESEQHPTGSHNVTSEHKDAETDELNVANRTTQTALALDSSEVCEKESRDETKKSGEECTRDSETEVEELRKLWKTHTMQQTKEQRETVQQASNKEVRQKTGKITEGSLEGNIVSKEKRRHRSHKFLCLRVGKPMRKTFVSVASASMQQYAQRDRKHEYWFAVPHERAEHLYVFFVQWSPDMYGNETGESSKEPGFMVAARNEESEMSEYSVSESALKDWEITTRDETSLRQNATSKPDLELETFRPNLSEKSDLLQTDQIEKLAKNLPPRTVGYPWTLIYSTSKHGMSLKTLYRSMTGVDTPMLLVIKDSDGQLFGALASEPFKVSDCFYGTGETFLFTFYPEFKIFKWTGDNMFFIKGDMDSLAFGGGGGEIGLWLDGDLYHGRSHACKTFDNHILSKKEDFYVQDIEIWAFE
ncbi:oxidation resistance protein 1a isoform X3 [Pristis pectinata]|uniref:oxidation resistance protein 1a isoform X3 n=1 Tax=Pristis pectinata TaxID=685728 RepID=UPI00223D0A17|nr:oxidation resistance protein 1a isoform X3 [Pristis pectinata]